MRIVVGSLCHITTRIIIIILFILTCLNTSISQLLYQRTFCFENFKFIFFKTSCDSKLYYVLRMPRVMGFPICVSAGLHTQLLSSKSLDTRKGDFFKTLSRFPNIVIGYFQALWKNPKSSGVRTRHHQDCKDMRYC